MARIKAKDLNIEKKLDKKDLKKVRGGLAPKSTKAIIDPLFRPGGSRSIIDPLFKKGIIDPAFKTGSSKAIIDPVFKTGK